MKIIILPVQLLVTVVKGGERLAVAVFFGELVANDEADRKLQLHLLNALYHHLHHLTPTILHPTLPNLLYFISYNYLITRFKK